TKVVLALLILVSRVGDVVTTFFVTPTLKLEANPVVRKLGWRFAILSLAVSLIPWWSVGAGIVILVPSLMVSAGNAARIWAARTMGEASMKKMMLDLARRSTLRLALVPIYASSAFLALLGLVLIWLCPDPVADPAYWFGAGIVAYGIVIALHGSFAYVRLFK